MCSSPISNPAVPLNVIFVHGWACSWRDWSGVISCLFDYVQIGVVKFPGSPDAGPLEGAISLSECAAHVIAQADELGFERFAVVGHSMAHGLPSNWRHIGVIAFLTFLWWMAAMCLKIRMQRSHVWRGNLRSLASLGGRKQLSRQ